MTSSTARIGLLIEEEESGFDKTYQIIGRFVYFASTGEHQLFCDYTFEPDQPYALAHLHVAGMGFDYSPADRHVRILPLSYRRATEWLELPKIESMAATLKKVNASLDRDAKRDGHASSIGQVFLRIARTLGADCMVLRNRSEWADEKWRTVDLSDGCSAINQLVRTWEVNDTSVIIAS